MVVEDAQWTTRETQSQMEACCVCIFILHAAWFEDERSVELLHYTADGLAVILVALRVLPSYPTEHMQNVNEEPQPPLLICSRASA